MKFRTKSCSTITALLLFNNCRLFHYFRSRAVGIVPPPAAAVAAAAAAAAATTATAAAAAAATAAAAAAAAAPAVAVGTARSARCATHGDREAVGAEAQQRPAPPRPEGKTPSRRRPGNRDFGWCQQCCRPAGAPLAPPAR